MLEMIDPIKMMNETWRSVSSPPSRTTLQHYEYSYVLISERGGAYTTNSKMDVMLQATKVVRSMPSQLKDKRFTCVEGWTLHPRFGPRYSKHSNSNPKEGQSVCEPVKTFVLLQ